MVRFLLLAVLLLQPSHGQIVLNAAPPKDPGVISVDVDLVNVLCTVRDRNGNAVKDLTREDFEIREDGRRQEITHFARDVDSPMTVALLLDVSGSVSTIIGIEKAAAARFFQEVIRPKDQAALVGFAERIVIWQDLTPSVDKLTKALEQAGPFAMMPATYESRPRGGTLLYDAANLVAEQKLELLPGRKTMILITDGEDNGSLVKLEAAVKSAQKADTVIYGIHYQGEMNPLRSGQSALEKLSQPTGGRMFHVSKSMPLETIFDTITEEMRGQYGVGYALPAHSYDGGFHKLEVKTKAGLKVQVRSGYFANRR